MSWMWKYRGQLIVRGLLTGCMLIGIFKETGIWTVLFAFLVAATLEVINYNLKIVNRKLKDAGGK